MLQPFPYQLEGQQFLTSHTRGLLADEMGVGKTGQAILSWTKLGAERVLVMCPANVRSGWLKALPDFCEKPLPARVMLTAGHDPLATGLTICSYDLGIREAMKKKLLAMPWDVVVTDEEHYLKERDSKRTELVFGKGCAAGPGSLIADADYFWGLSGTPAPNHAGELYPILRAYGLYKGGYLEFINYFCVILDTVYGPKVVKTKPEKLTELKALLKTFMLRRKWADVQKDRPDILFSQIFLDPSECDTELLKELMEEEKGEEAAALNDILSGELDELPDGMQFARFRRLTGLVKIKPIARQISEELELGMMDKVLVWAVHREVVEGIAGALAKFGSAMLYGGMTPAAKDAVLEKFKREPATRVLVMNVTAGGTGIDGLQHVAADEIFAESSWALHENEQATRRLYRTGQKRHVRSRYASVANTLDEQIQKVLVRKAADIKNIFE
jgi:SNF2 family DNA or RNA helicase